MPIVVLENMDAHMCHRLDGHAGHCKYLHGHTYRFDVAIESKELNEMGMAIDFGDIKRIVKTWINENFDHAFVYDVNDEVSEVIAGVLEEFGLSDRVFSMNVKPTAENMVEMLYDIFDVKFQMEYGQSVKLIGLKVWETSKAYAMKGRFSK